MHNNGYPWSGSSPENPKFVWDFQVKANIQMGILCLYLAVNANAAYFMLKVYTSN